MKETHTDMNYKNTGRCGIEDHPTDSTTLTLSEALKLQTISIDNIEKRIDQLSDIIRPLIVDIPKNIDDECKKEWLQECSEFAKDVRFNNTRIQHLFEQINDMIYNLERSI